MVYLSCFPAASPISGVITLEEKREQIPSFLANSVFLMSSTLLYPALLAITSLSQIYMAIDYSIHHYKKGKLDRKIKHLIDLPDNEIDKMRKQKLAGLNLLHVFQEKRVYKIVGKTDDLENCEVYKNIKKSYEDGKEEVKSNSSIKASARVKALEDKIKTIRYFINTCEEIDAYEDKTTSEVRNLLIEKIKFAKIRRELTQKIDTHYSYDLFILSIPIIGMLFLANSKYTTKVALEKTNLVDEYNAYIGKYKWLKPYDNRIFRKSSQKVIIKYEKA